MPLRFLLDEHIRRTMWSAILRHNFRSQDVLDVARVGAEGAPRYGTLDPELLIWSEAEGRILLTEDKSTMPAHLGDHLARGNHSPGVMMLRRGVFLSDLTEFLCLATYASEPGEWEDRITYIP
ncbi:MAG TPA: hypothetical protein VFE47_11560 [Tepidisphaeraceae bacterium]|jgi:hypothetical protein|nr:hypothetical protein [Tepidisphaeraceae bacterium]